MVQRRSTFGRPIEENSAPGQWEMARTPAPGELRPYVREYVGWWERSPQPLVRRELPTDLVPVIISFGAPIRIFDGDESRGWTDHRSFTTGVYDRFVLVGTSPVAGGLQVNLTFLGARLFLGRPLGDLVNCSVSLRDLLGSAAEHLADELQSATGWAARFAILDRELTQRIRASRQPSSVVLRASRRLIESGGRRPIASVLAEVGCSQKHLIAQFKSEIGLTPKRLARVLRFGRAVERLKTGRVDLASLALDCGYYDQPHFDRDFKSFAGLSPSALLACALPTGGFAAAMPEGTTSSRR